MQLKVKILKDGVKVPNYATPGDAGLDLYCLQDIAVQPGEHVRIWHGFALEFPHGYVALVKDKGSISHAGLHQMGGVFDVGYRGEYNTHLVNLSQETYHFSAGDKVSQLVILPIAQAEIKIVDELSESERGEGRFGSTGKQ